MGSMRHVMNASLAIYQITVLNKLMLGLKRRVLKKGVTIGALATFSPRNEINLHNKGINKL
jgi:hypothetical protein